MVPPGHSPRTLRIEHLRTRAFRNLAALDLELDPRFHILEGDNGQGKSNVLEAVCLVGWQRSFRGARNDEMIQLGAPSARVDARLAVDGEPARQVTVELRPGAKSIRLDGKRAPSPGVYFGIVQMVLFHPGELELVAGAPASRRMLLDRVLYQTDRTYPSVHRDFQRALRSRNKLLREGASRSVIRAFDRPLADAAVRIVEARRRLAAEIAPAVSVAFAEIAGTAGDVDVRYRPRSEARSPEALMEELERTIDRDLHRGATGAGPQGDDLEILLDGQPARPFASQGQTRAIVLAIKSAEVAIVEARSGQRPILLLDDVSSELDEARRRHLFGRLAHSSGQVLMTTTDASFIPVRNEAGVTRIRCGQVDEST